MKRTKSTSGITLIALVITIILLVILATISINAVFGDNGLITKAQKAGEVYEEKQEWERLELVKGEVAFDSAQSGNTGKYTVEDYVNRLEDKGMVAQKPQGGTGTDPQTIITDKGWVVHISQDGERNVVFSIEKYQGTIVIPMRITGMTLTPSLKNMTIGVSITASNTDGATYKYYYKKAIEGEGAYKEVYSGGNTSYTITGNESGATALEADVIYTIKVVAERGSGANKETTELTKNIEIKSVPIAQGAIEYRDLTWSNGKASVKVVKTISGNYTMKYEVDKAVGTDIGKTGITSGETISNLEVGDVVLVRLIDSDGVEGQPVDLTITDIAEPKQAKIILSTKTVTTGNNITATIEQEDEQSGVDIENCKWVYTTIKESLGTLDTDLSKYEEGVENETYGGFAGATVTGNKVTKGITLTVSTIGEYYIHILTQDKAGNRIETISEKITIIEGILLDLNLNDEYFGASLLELETQRYGDIGLTEQDLIDNINTKGFSTSCYRAQKGSDETISTIFEADDTSNSTGLFLYKKYEVKKEYGFTSTSLGGWSLSGSASGYVHTKYTFDANTGKFTTYESKYGSWKGATTSGNYPSSTLSGFYSGVHGTFGEMVSGSGSTDVDVIYYVSVGSTFWKGDKLSGYVNELRSYLKTGEEAISDKYIFVIGNYDEGFDEDNNYYYEKVEEVSPIKVVELDEEYNMLYEYNPQNNELVTKAINIQDKDKYNLSCTGINWTNNSVSISGDGNQWTSVNGETDMYNKINNTNWNYLYIKIENISNLNYLKVEYVIK